MLPGMKHRIKIWPSNRSGQTIVRPTRFGSVSHSCTVRIPDCGRDRRLGGKAQGISLRGHPPAGRARAEGEGQMTRLQKFVEIGGGILSSRLCFATQLVTQCWAVHMIKLTDQK
jgi:hypothetical protein